MPNEMYDALPNRFEDALRESHAQLQAVIDVIDSAPFGVYVVDSDMRIRHVNPIAMPIFDRIDNVIGRDLTEVLHILWPPEVAADAVERFRNTCETGEPYVVPEFSEERRDKNGREYYTWQLHRITLPDGQRGVAAYFMDISAHVLAREAIARLTAESERQRRLYEAILSSMSDFAYIFARDGRFLFANQALLDLWGLKLEDSVGKNFHDLNYPADLAARLQRQIQQVFDTGAGLTDETPYTSPAGAGGYYEYIFRPVFGAGGEVEAVAGTTRDITERKRSEEALRESADRLRFMAESMPQKIFRTKANGDMDYLNQQWITFTGLSLEEIKSSGWRQFVHPGDIEENARLWQRSLDTGEPFQFAHRLRRADGVYRWHLTRLHAMRGADGKVSMWIGSSTDIQEEKEAEEELRRANEDLNQFAFAASHDLQEPLRMIAAYSQLLVRRHGSLLGDEASLFMNYITEGTQRMAELLADLLSYTKAAGDGVEPIEPVDFNAVFDRAAQNLRASVAESGAVISCDRLPVVHGREGHFLQLLQNLIGNGIKYRGERTPRIHVSAEQLSGEWRFAVADNGMGIAPEYRQQIFGVFKRLHGKNIPGTGIGLAICQRVVERYGGRIWVESEP
ncbi:MAG: PAS domain S-box protein, partial [Bryobacteraceae bacterium]